ncbi:hypothetical protein MMC30_006504 [Trapelia coarctata]|nr:hypothetical protein [Trapelia coarctata]
MESLSYGDIMTSSRSDSDRPTSEIERSRVALRNGQKIRTTLAELVNELGKLGVDGPRHFRNPNLDARGAWIDDGAQFDVFADSTGLLTNMVIKRVKPGLHWSSMSDSKINKSTQSHLRTLQLEINSLHESSRRKNANIVDLIAWGYDYPSSDTSLALPVLIMEKALASLTKFLADSDRHVWGAITSKVKYQICMDIAEGLKGVHSSSLAHGDLKPSKILIFKHSDPKVPFVAKLSDFGLCIDVASAGTKFASYRGIDGWLPPEVMYPASYIADRELFLLQKSDVFMFGLLVLSVFYTKGEVLRLGQSSSLEYSLAHFVQNQELERDCEPYRQFLVQFSRSVLALSPQSRPDCGFELFDPQKPGYIEWLLHRSAEAKPLISTSGRKDADLYKGFAYWSKLDVAVLRQIQRQYDALKDRTTKSVLRSRGDMEAVVQLIRDAAELDYPPAQAIMYRLLEASESFGRGLDVSDQVRKWSFGGASTGSRLAALDLSVLAPVLAQNAPKIFVERGGYNEELSPVALSGSLQFAQLPSNVGLPNRPDVVVDQSGNRPLHIAATIQDLPLDLTMIKLVTLFSDYGLPVISASLALIDSQTQRKVSTITVDQSSEYQKSKLASLRITLGRVNIDFRALDEEMLGLTPLNDIPASDNSVDAIAITGLAGRAFGSWQNSNGTMWLRGFLTRDIENLRVYVYGYDSKLKDSNSFARLLDYTKAFVRTLEMFKRGTARKRPLILIRHSLECLIIKQAICEVLSDDINKEFGNRVHSIVLFGAPHDGMDTQSLESRTRGSVTENTILDLRRDSRVLMSLKSRFGRLTEDLRILTCYETRTTPTVEASRMRTKFQLTADRSEIAKLSDNHEYHQVRKYIKEYVLEAPHVVKARFFSADCAEILEITTATANKLGSLLSKRSLRWYSSAQDPSAWESMLHSVSAITEIMQAFRQLFRQKRLSKVLLRSLKSALFAGKIEYHVGRLKNLFSEYEVALRGTDGFEALPQSQARSRNLESVDEESFRSIHGGLFNTDSLALLSHKASEIFQRLKQTILFLILDPDVLAVEKFSDTFKAQNAGLAKTALRQLFLRRSQARVGKEQVQEPNRRQGHLGESNQQNSDLTFATWNGIDGSTHRVIVQHRSYAASTARGRQLQKIFAVKARKKEQINRLAWVLQNVTSDLQDNGEAKEESITDTNQGVLQYWDHIDQSDSKQVAFLYKLPPFSRSLEQANITTLYNHIALASDARSVTPLEQRFAMAKSLCQSVLTLHSWGWVHKDIRSSNIILVPMMGDAKFAMTKGVGMIGSSSVPILPSYATCLAGFEFSRHAQDISDQTETSESTQNLYRHPERQGVPKQNFTKIHDLYALGVVLYEIGVFRTVRFKLRRPLDAWEKENVAPDSGRIARAILTVARAELPAAMGSRYTEAVVRCLEGGFGVVRDDEWGSELGLRFQEMVLDRMGVEDAL